MPLIGLQEIRSRPERRLHIFNITDVTTEAYGETLVRKSLMVEWEIHPLWRDSIPHLEALDAF